MHHPRRLSSRGGLALLAAVLVSAGVLASGCTSQAQSDGQPIPRVTATKAQMPPLLKPVYAKACTDDHHACAMFPTDGDPSGIGFLKNGVQGVHTAGLLVSSDGHKICPNSAVVLALVACQTFQQEVYRLQSIPYPGLNTKDAFESWLSEHDPNASGRPVPGIYHGHPSLTLKHDYADGHFYLRLLWSEGTVYMMPVGSNAIASGNPKVVPPHFKFFETLALN